MITKQYKTYRYMMFRCSAKYFTNSMGTSVIAEPLYSFGGDFGNGMYLARCYAPAGTDGTTGEYSSTSASGANKLGVFFGSGSTPPTEDDYCLDVPITTGLSITNANTIMEEHKGDGNHIFSASYSVKNTTEEEITIREIGYFGEVGRFQTTNKYWYSHVLFERTVLSTPIVLATGVTKIITYTLTFNQPS